MSSEHFDDFAPTLWAGPPATYPDVYVTGMKGRWIVTDAGVLWTDDTSLLGLDTSSATDWSLVTGIRTTLAAQFALKTPATALFSQLQEELSPEEWFDGDLAAAGVS